MPLEVILMADIKGLGAEGEVVRVADGYARNYLLPRNLAAPVTEATRRRLEKKRKERDVQLARDREGAQALAEKINAMSCTIPVKAGEENKIFGSVTSADIAAVLAGQGVQIDKHQIDLPDAIRELGVFNVDVKLHPDLKATLKIWVVEE